MAGGEQDIRPHDRRPDALLRDLHALLLGRDAEELSAVRVPFGEYRGADHAGGAVFEVLEVGCFFLFSFLLYFAMNSISRLIGHLLGVGVGDLWENIETSVL